MCSVCQAVLGLSLLQSRGEAPCGAVFKPKNHGFPEMSRSGGWTYPDILREYLKKMKIGKVLKSELLGCSHG